MKKISTVRATAAGALMITVAGLTSCDRSNARAPEETDRSTSALAAVPELVSGGEHDATEARGLWLAMADDPLHHLRAARELLVDGKRDEAARQLDLSAYLFKWGHLYAEGLGQRRDFMATAQQLEAAARRLRRGEGEDLSTLDQTMSAGLRAMATLHATEVMGEWKAGEYTRAALLLRATADEVEGGFSLSGTPPGGTIERALTDAESVADRLDSRTPPEEREVRDAVEGLRDGASGLAGVLGPRSS